MKAIPYSRQLIDDNDIEAVSRVLRSDFITQGPKVKEFEDALADYCGARYAVVFNSGTSALHAAYFSCGLGPGDEFITSPITFVATANAGLYLGAKPVFVDIEPDTANIDVSKIEGAITKNTKLIVPVHFSGQPADMERIYEIAKRHKLYVVEDACHALGAKYKNNKVGSCRYSDITVFSFHPVKLITTGEGGAVLTNNEEFYRKLLIFREHGISRSEFINEPHGVWYYEMHELGYNYRLTDIQCALGLSQLKKLDKFIARRKEIASIYDDAFSKMEKVDFIREKQGFDSSRHLYVILVDKRKEVFNFLRTEAKIMVNVHYIPVYLHPYYQRLGYKHGLCPKAEEYYGRAISIPMFPKLTNDEVLYVVEKVRKAAANNDLTK